MSNRHSVYLSDEEIMLIDGRCNKEAQAKVNMVKRIRHLSAPFAGQFNEIQTRYIGQILEMAERKGQVSYSGCQMVTCPICKLNHGYVRFKSGKRAGENNYDKRIYVGGMEFDPTAGSRPILPETACCYDCLKLIKEAIITGLKSIACVVPERLTGEPPIYKLELIMACDYCQFMGFEKYFRGPYNNHCPQCKTNLGFSRFRRVDKALVTVGEAGKYNIVKLIKY